MRLLIFDAVSKRFTLAYAIAALNSDLSANSCFGFSFTIRT
jgi:hypothetical protein